MGRPQLVRSTLVRAILGTSTLLSNSCSNPLLHPSPTIRSTPSTSLQFPVPPNLSPFDLHFSKNRITGQSFSSSARPSNIVAIKSGEELNESLKKVQDDGLSAIFYFTAVWCGPCKFISPIIEELSKKYLHVTTYKVDIDQEGLGDTLSKLHIYSVPTLHFFQNGEKATEIVGADVTRLKSTMEGLY